MDKIQLARILRQIDRDVKKACSRYIGEPIVPETTDELAKKLKDNLQRAVAQQNIKITSVTPTFDDKIFNVQFELPVYRYIFEVPKVPKEE